MSGHAWMKALDYVGRIIEVGPNSKGDDGNWDPGMRALVLWITEDEPDVWIAKVDFRPFIQNPAQNLVLQCGDPERATASCLSIRRGLCWPTLRVCVRA